MHMAGREVGCRVGVLNPEGQSGPRAPVPGEGSYLGPGPGTAPPR